MVSVVVVTRDRPALLRQTLEALQRQTWEPREVVVVDHAGTVALDVEGVRVVRCPNVTLGTARQAGVDASAGDIIAFTDDDCLPEPAWLSELVNAFRENPGSYGVQGRTRAAPGPIGSHAVQVARPNTLYQTCNIAYRSEALERAGGFDHVFGGWFEDTALAARVLEHGPIGFAPAALVTHQAVPRRPLERASWHRLLEDERLLARRYPAFYRRTRGISPGMAITVRWLLGSPLKLLARELPRAFRDVRGYAALIVALLRERMELIRALRSSSR